MAIGTTCRARATSGRLMKRRAQVGIPTVAEAGFRLPPTATPGLRASPGALCRMPRACGITTTDSAGVGSPVLEVPWWGGGGWVSNIGNAPFRYHPPIRPRGGPVRPGGGSMPIRAGGRYEPNPVIAVNRMHDTAAGPPIRARGSPVTVAGNTVQPLRPIASRPTYCRRVRRRSAPRN